MSALIEITATPNNLSVPHRENEYEASVGNDNGQLESPIQSPCPPSTDRCLDQRISPTSGAMAATLAHLRQPLLDDPPNQMAFAPALSADQFQQLLGHLTTKVTKEENPLAIARAEFYISQGLSFKFDGTQEKLAPWIKKFRTLRGNALWRAATYITHGGVKLDLLNDFTRIKESVIKAQAMNRASVGNQEKSLKPEHTELFYPRILGKVIVDSITDEFSTILQNYAGDELAGDGPYLLWLLLTHFHTSTITYQEQVKQKIRARNLSKDHDDDVEAYLLWLRHHLDILNTTTTSGIGVHADLMDPIFTQLLTTKSSRLRRLVEDWHLAYHTEDKAITPLTLVEDAERKCRALRQSNQLYNVTDNELMALLVAKPLPGLYTTQANGPGKQPSSGKQSTHKKGDQRQPRPSWYDIPPQHPNQTHQHDNRVWHWCSKCGASGKWVCTHTGDTHRDNFQKKRKGDLPQGDRRPSPSPPPNGRTATAIDHAELARLVAAQLTTQLHANIAAPVPPAASPPTADLGTASNVISQPEETFMEATEW